MSLPPDGILSCVARALNTTLTRAERDGASIGVTARAERHSAMQHAHDRTRVRLCDEGG